MKSSYSTGKFILMSIFVVLFFPSIIILLSGDLLWLEGWILSVWFDVMMLGNMIYMFKKDPELFKERLNAHGSHNQKKWDKFLLASLFILSAFWMIIMPLDAKMFGWSLRFPLYLKVVGGVLLIPSLYFLIKASIDNPYLSTVVRIQSDRKQKVISAGVYGFVRHPQYLGIVLLIAGSPFLLGSVIGLITGALITFIMVIRIVGEENALMKELKGYVKYRKKVKYRLLPYVW